VLQLNKKFNTDNVLDCFKDDNWPEVILNTYPIFKKLSSCQQDPKYHEEGDVWTHTIQVVNSLLDDEEWQNMYSTDVKCVLVMSALFHDIGKIYTTKHEGDRITSMGHAHCGARMVREILWDFNDYHVDVPWWFREEVANLVMLHMLPHNFLKKEDPLYYVISASMLVNTQFLEMLARADTNGRTCADEVNKQEGVEGVQVFGEFCVENHCYGREKQFKTEYGRYKYLADHEGHPDYNVYEGHYKGEVIMMSGLPGSGKDFFANRVYGHLDMVSLDSIRKELKIKPTDNQGQVSQLAKERCRKHMRVGNKFVFNATNINKSTRSRWIKVFKQYNYRVLITYVEPNFNTVLQQNRIRENAVPEAVIMKMFRKLDVPSIIECDFLEIARTNYLTPASV